MSNFKLTTSNIKLRGLRKAESGRIRFYDEPVAEMRLRTPDRHPLRGRPVGRGI